MRQTLLRIPLDADWSFGFFQVPGFGLGLLLVLWILLGGYWLYRNRAEIQVGRLLVPGLLWFLVAYAIVIIPGWVQSGPRSVIAAQTMMIDQQTTSRQSLEQYKIRGNAYQQVYEYENAANDFQAMIDQAPDLDAGYLELAWLRATCPDPEFRDGEKAVNLAQSALETARTKTAIHYDTLAAAYAEAGDFEKAVLAEQGAAKAAEASVDPVIRERLQGIRNRLQQFTQQQPHRESRFVESFPQSLPIRGYGFLMFLGFIGAGLTASRLAARVGITSDVIWDLGIWGLLGGIVGARLFYLVQYHERVFGGKSGMALLTAPFELQEGGLVLLGGVLMGSAVFVGYCLYRGLKPLLMADIALPGFFVALAFGRLGCLMNGCCYGDRCELPWAIQFPLGSVPDMALVIRGFVSPDSPASMALHPSQIYSSLNALILAFLTATYFRYRNRDGAVLALGMLTYPITRFAIEYLRGDEMGQYGTGFTISQLVSIGLFTGGLVYLFWLSRRPRTITPIQAPNPKAPHTNTKQPASAAAG